MAASITEEEFGAMKKEISSDMLNLTSIASSVTEFAGVLVNLIAVISKQDGKCSPKTENAFIAGFSLSTFGSILRALKNVGLISANCTYINALNLGISDENPMTCRDRVLACFKFLAVIFPLVNVGLSIAAINYFFEALDTKPSNDFDCHVAIILIMVQAITIFFTAMAEDGLTSARQAMKKICEEKVLNHKLRKELAKLKASNDYIPVDDIKDIIDRTWSEIRRNTVNNHDEEIGDNEIDNIKAALEKPHYIDSSCVLS